MAFKDILLVLITYPEATNASGIHAAVSLTTALGARISAVACVVKVRAPHYPLSDAFIDIPALVDSEMKKSAEASTELIGVFEQAAKSAGVFQESLVKSCLTSGAPDLLVREARLRDLTVLPGIAEGYNYRWYAESIVFGSGRPLLVLPPHVKPDLAFRRIVVAWDGSRSASRAVADALSLLERAEEVRALTILNEKEMNGESPGLDLAGSLHRRGVSVKAERIDAAGRSIGEVLSTYLNSNEADFLVMGAYGHSRLREFILGGATLSMLSHPSVPTLLSH